jgi:hypothetical protein
VGKQTPLLREGSALLVSLVVVSLAGDALAGAASRKMERQISLFERVVDEMLIDSRNWLVRGHDNARGTYVEGHGLVVTFDATLVNSDFDYGNHWFNIPKIWRGKHRIVIDDDDWEGEKELEDRRGRSRDYDRKWYEREVERGGKLYERGRAELVDVFLDFGEYLSSLQDSDWLELEASLGNAPYFIEKDLTTLTLRAKMSDVRDFAAGRINEQQFVQRIETKES